MFIQLEGDNLTELWFNFLVHTCTGNYSTYYNPSVFNRRVYGSTKGIHFSNEILERDFYRYSGYNKGMKISKLRSSYFSEKVEDQHKLLKSIIRKLQPRQNRGLISFSEPAFDENTRLKCLDSLYVQKQSMTTYEALIVFRNTEIYPKTFMDFVFLHEILSDYTEEKVKCTTFSVFMTSCFINMFNAPLAAMLLRKHGIKSWNDPFRSSLKSWKSKFEDPSSVGKIKMQFIYRIIERTHRLMEEDGIDIEMLIQGK